MVINQNFGVALHILTILSLNSDKYTTSKELANSVDTNPVVVRRILKQLENNNLIITKQGKFGSKINCDLEQITFYDVYKIFNDGDIIKPTHNPNKNCPIGKNINEIMMQKLSDINATLENELMKHSINEIKTQMEELIK